MTSLFAEQETVLTRVGFTGHQVIPDNVLPSVIRDMREFLSSKLPLVLITSLAAGADQIAADITLGLGGEIDVVVPCRNYRITQQGSDLAQYDRLLALATRVQHRVAIEPKGEVFTQAGLHMLAQSDILLAVWDGRPADGFGGTADMVREAQHRGIETHIIWPQGFVVTD